MSEPPSTDHDPMAIECPSCGAEAGERCHWDCQSNWDNHPTDDTWCAICDDTRDACTCQPPEPKNESRPVSRTADQFRDHIDRLHDVAENVFAEHRYPAPAVQTAAGVVDDVWYGREMRIPVSHLGDSALVAFLDSTGHWSTAYAIDMTEMDRPNRILLAGLTHERYPLPAAMASFGYTEAEIEAAIAANAAEAAGRLPWLSDDDTDGACPTCGGRRDLVADCPDCPKEAVVTDEPFDPAPMPRPRFEELRRLAYEHGAVAAAVSYPARLNMRRLPVADVAAIFRSDDVDPTARDGIATIACHGGPANANRVGVLRVSLNTRGVPSRVPLAKYEWFPHCSWLRSLLP